MATPLNKGIKSPYTGILIPQDLFLHYEIQAERSSLLEANLIDPDSAFNKCENIDWRDIALTAGAGFLTGIALVYATQQ